MKATLAPVVVGNYVGIVEEGGRCLTSCPLPGMKRNPHGWFAPKASYPELVAVLMQAGFQVITPRGI